MDRKCEEHQDRDSAGFCTKCGRAMCEDCLQKISGRNICVSCLSADLKKNEADNTQINIASRKPVEGDRITPSRPRRSAPTASITMKEVRRVVAVTIDFVLLLVVSLPLSWFLMQLTKLFFMEVHGIGYTLSFYLVFIILSSVYFITLHWRYGKTAGKLLMQLRVVDYAADGDITFMQSFWRWIGFMTGVIWADIGYWIASSALGWMAVFKDKIPSWMISIGLLAGIVFTGLFSLGLLITFVGKYKRGFHDLLGSTIVRVELRNERRS